MADKPEMIECGRECWTKRGNEQPVCRVLTHIPPGENAKRIFENYAGGTETISLGGNLVHRPRWPIRAEHKTDYWRYLLRRIDNGAFLLRRVDDVFKRVSDPPPYEPRGARKRSRFLRGDSMGVPHVSCSSGQTRGYGIELYKSRRRELIEERAARNLFESLRRGRR